jgi:hypothetical protein
MRKMLRSTQERPSSYPPEEVPLNVFSISPAGEVRVHRLKVEGDYRLYTVKTAQNSWIVEFLHDVPHSMAQEFSTYAFDPETGAPLREYLLPANLGWGLACTDGDEFHFLRANEKTHTLELASLHPQQSQTRTKDTPGRRSICLGNCFRKSFY